MKKVPYNIRKDDDGQVQVVIGEEVEVVPWLQTFVYKHEEVNHWFVTEYSTGARISGGRTRKLAIENAKQVLESIGQETVYRLVKETLEREGRANT